MLAGLSRFWRKRSSRAAAAPDSVVAPSRIWLIRAALLASTLALLGTSPEDDGRRQGTHSFRRTVAGEAVELTQDEPNATFMVTIRADSLGPDGAQSSDGAAVEIVGTIAPSGISQEPALALKLDGGSQLEFRRAFNTRQALLFEGSCEQPSPNTPCQASLLVELARDDDGELGGVLSVEWSLDLRSSAQVDVAVGDEGELDPPWSVEIVRL